MNTRKNMEERFAKEMEARSVYYEPKGSPWGEVQTYRYLSHGVFFVSTASHGGVIVLKELADRYFTKEAQACCFPYGKYLCFEEDCDAPVAIRELLDKGIMKTPVNEYYKRGEYEAAINDSLKQWHPQYWQAREQRLQKNEQPKQKKSKEREER